eukprot:scaffold17036_cov44-Phaeocystis_antarctica.AAC.1
MATVYPAARNLFTAVTYTRSRNCSLPIRALRPPEDITRRRRREDDEKKKKKKKQKKKMMMMRYNLGLHMRGVTGQGWTRTGAEGIWGEMWGGSCPGGKAS